MVQSVTGGRQGNNQLISHIPCYWLPWQDLPATETGGCSCTDISSSVSGLGGSVHSSGGVCSAWRTAAGMEPHPTSLAAAPPSRPQPAARSLRGDTVRSSLS